MAGSSATAGMAGSGPGRGLAQDPTAHRIVAFLRDTGAAHHGHAGGRPLLDHLLETAEIVRRWNQPPVLQYAALLHSIYGTEAHHRPVVPVSSRDEVRQLAGDQAERLAYLFAITPRRLLTAGTHRWTRDLPLNPARGGADPLTDRPADRDELDALVLLHMANLSEQACAPDRSPGAWLVRLRRLAELLIDSEVVALPLCIAGLAAFTDDDEELLLSAYRTGTSATSDIDTAGDRLALAAAACPVVAEPCLWLSHVCRRRGDLIGAAGWARRGRRRLHDLGAAWDKRLTCAQWLDLTHCLQRSAPDHARPPAAVSHPRMLYETYVTGRRAGGGVPSRPRSPAAPPALPSRFERYVEALAQSGPRAARVPYPELESRPWHDPADFPVAANLHAHYPQIRDEILALEPSRFHRESERIGRAGDWDVAFFYDRGRRHDDVCAACPVTTRGIERPEAVRSLAGLIYVSRMRAGTHISAHRGPTNLRLRCHLGISVPDGDCAIRVDDETRRWVEGECLIFDDHFEHEAWNHTAADRIVLIVDLWHPGLTAAEITLLAGVHGYAAATARQLTRYWSVNTAAAAGARASEG